MTRPAILDAIDQALETNLASGLIVMADEAIIADVVQHLHAWEDGRFQRGCWYSPASERVAIRTSTAQLPAPGWLVRVVPGHDRPAEQPRDAQGRFLPWA